MSRVRIDFTMSKSDGSEELISLGKDDIYRTLMPASDNRIVNGKTLATRYLEEGEVYIVKWTLTGPDGATLKLDWTHKEQSHSQIDDKVDGSTDRQYPGGFIAPGRNILLVPAS